MPQFRGGKPWWLLSLACPARRSGEIWALKAAMDQERVDLPALSCIPCSIQIRSLPFHAFTCLDLFGLSMPTKGQVYLSIDISTDLNSPLGRNGKENRKSEIVGACCWRTCWLLIAISSASAPMPTGIIIVADAEGVMCFAPTHNFQTYRSYRQLRILTKTSADMAAKCSYVLVLDRPIRPPANPAILIQTQSEVIPLHWRTPGWACWVSNHVPSNCESLSGFDLRQCHNRVIHGHPKTYPLGVQEQSSI